MIKDIETYLQNSQNAVSLIPTNKVAELAEAIMHAYHEGSTIYTMGNGGSGATASHVAGDYVKGASFGLEKRFRFICLNDNIPALMAISNDISYEAIFEEQLKNFARPGDLVIGLSGSGNSKNIVNALQWAKNQGIKTAALTGYKGGLCAQIADISIHIPMSDMEIVEDLHMMTFHAIKRYITNTLLGENPGMGAVYDQRIK
ncbi:phosphoheptose isomerase [Thermaurantimonas aggregans]|uniref:Phosphoheptose isomerase n=1 Tax=Thermaurantimonas aggregans TaxID=2173829 RepID=A0A401XJ17_9FLAO|nr:SIS domain-containing protein [Thermaurantimonas aggregans]MCX8148984.1 SIS domain-containing protein [Thermaurantimonas aggregans]GCD77000.1 phosphoheptose isomerase [Thermaurantimonas aggregans]